MNTEIKNTYTLNVVTLKNGKFTYTVTDQDGKVITSRTSTRQYVACTIDGFFFFGRLDLIGKGDHGRSVKNGDTTPIAYLKN